MTLNRNGQSFWNFMKQHRDEHENSNTGFRLRCRADRHAIEECVNRQTADSPEDRVRCERSLLVRFLAEVHVARKNMLEKMQRAKADQHGEQCEIVPIREREAFRNKFQESKRQ